MKGGSGVSRRTVLGLIASQVANAAVGKALAASAGEQKQPNVVFVLVDDAGYGDFACNGNPVIKTPNLDKLHDESARFREFHVSPTCSPTRAALMTGRYSNATGVWHTIHGRSILNSDNVTLAECFKSSGYRTGIYGKWHLGDNYPYRPHDRGFDDAVVCGGGGLWQTPDYFGNDDTDDTYLHNGKFQKYEGFSTNVFFDLAMDFMRDAQTKQQPFFCYLATTAAHVPYWSLEKDSAPYEGVTGLASSGFYGMIANIDENVGRMRTFLQESGLAENTIFLFSSDNGTAEGENVFNASMRGSKGSPYDGGHREPLFFHWPGGGLAHGQEVEALTSHIDVLPTLVDLCRLKNRGKDVDGKSWRPLLYGGAQRWEDRTVVVDSQREEFLVKWKDAAVMTQRWRLVNPSLHGDPNQLELYDIEKDPGQKINLAAHHPEVVAALKAEYESWWNRVSVGGKEYVRIVIGSDQENPSSLNSMDWHGDGSEMSWNQTQIRTAPLANGFWALEVSRSGRYRFELRRWPREVDLPINAPYVDAKPNREKTPGVAIAATSAQIMIGDVHQTKPISPDAKFVAFECDLPKGPAELRTSFYDAVLNERGAYYVYVERL
jgi:arylsulfatase A-like enzyme